MILTDLESKIPWDNLFSIIKTKLHHTMIMFHDKWYEAMVSEDMYEVEDGYKYGEGPEWLYLHNGNGHTIHSLNSLEEIDTEPEWPEAGYYYSHLVARELTYANISTYKAGLSPNLITMYNSKGKCANTMDVIRLLNEITAGEHVYPALEEADQLLWNSNNKHIPIGLELVVGAHPFVNGPVLIYKDKAIGNVKGDTVLLNKSNSHAEELLNHMGVKYVCQ